jgi:hypothetical protein
VLLLHDWLPSCWGVTTGEWKFPQCPLLPRVLKIRHSGKRLFKASIPFISIEKLPTVFVGTTHGFANMFLVITIRGVKSERGVTSRSMFPILIIFHYDISYPDLIFLLPCIYLHHEIIFPIIRALQKCNIYHVYAFVLFFKKSCVQQVTELGQFHLCICISIAFTTPSGISL